MTWVSAGTRLRFVIAGLLACVLFFSSLLEHLGSLRLFVVGLGFLALVNEVFLSGLRVRLKVIASAAIVAYIAVSVGVIELVAAHLEDRLFAVNAEHLLVLFPLFAVLGAILYFSGAARAYVNVILGIAVIVAAMAIVEAIFRVSLLGREYEFLTNQREGLTRALVGSDNSLILGATLAALVPLTLILRSTRAQILVAVLLVGGAWASGSRAPALICTVIAVVQFIPVARAMMSRFALALLPITAVVLAALAYLSINVWKPYIQGSTGIEYSSNYRGALYSLVPDLLSARPFGYLLASPPAGRWMVDSELHGSFDITRSVDSEVVFAAFGLGWVGLTLFVAALVVTICAIRFDVSLGLSALLLTALGFTLALHGWDSLSPLWYALLGASCWVVLLRSRRSPFAATANRWRAQWEG